MLRALIERRGPSSETYGILGRVYKARWEAALKAGDVFLARGLLDKAIDAYLRGFEADWRDALCLPLFARLNETERFRLRALAERLIREKTFSGPAGAEINGAVCATIAVQAALPVLNLDLESHGLWQEIIVYPAEFVPEREEMDEAGVVHHVRHPMSGEAWEGGPALPSAAAARYDVRMVLSPAVRP